ncbi:PDZ domain-containing protein [Desulfopila sp. IMCC35006]|uniref:ChaN family lipoprotein n=1 Tax=Desulfopila sp. IMCC35006 TaxID=2569542 RepID=UPI0010AD491B|nr:ChaN family lipoprotein [Desulfopila sp. IMCC35006]TKB26686.1 PDZ domain-containing protein [Desulfopila sp. IMCC35006]
MTYYTHHFPAASLFLALVLISCVCCSRVAEATAPQQSSYDLALSFVPEEGRLIGTARITIEPGQELSLYVAGLEITGSLLRDESGNELSIQPVQENLVLAAVKVHRTLYISYTKTSKNDFDDLISPQGIALTGHWYPAPSQPMRFHVTATLPDRFSAIVEADSFPLAQQGNTVSAVFSMPATAIHFIAGPYALDKQQVREGLVVYSMFFKEDQGLARGYLQAATDYLRHYEQEIGPYPYNHYVIVANRRPTGYGMPTFTLLGQAVLRLPFIKETSLGHEIVHSWFGNAVEVDYTTGNWCEGLTSFLADHAFREQKGEGVADRLESITRYLSYVHKDSAIPLAAFTSASHNQPMAQARRAVGYDRGAYLFYELREKIGRQSFAQGLHQFYRDNIGRHASWEDVEKSFATASGQNLADFFSERLQRNYIPSLAVEDIRTEYANGTPTLSFDVLQLQEKPYSLVVPIRIQTMTSTVNRIGEITGPKTRLSIPLEAAPLEFTVDPDYSFLRQVSEEELPAVWSRFLGAEKQLIILADESDRQLYQPLLDVLADTHPTVKTAAQVSNLELSDNDLLFLGINQAPSRALFALPNHPDEGFTLDVRRNPLNGKRVAVLVSSSGKDQSAAVARRLSHYGKYSYLEFKKGRNAVKRIQPARSDLHFVVEELPTGGATSALSPFTQVVARLADARVVYVGETHTSLADHLLQLRIIEAMHKKNPHLAIGMEMFPASSQPALDKYTLGVETMDERTFLKESDYYNVWRFDYRFFQEILNFARKNHLPVIGLNLDRQVVSEVFRAGGTDSLTREVQDSLPKDRDLDMPGYQERLLMMHDVHMQGSHGSGAASGFIQAQGLWDETMAKNITTFLTSHPDYRMVVLAGTQHTRKDSGIPPRVARRIPVQQVSVVNISDENAPGNLAQLADYYFLAAPAELPAAPKIGIVVDEQTKNKQSFLKISQLSPHGKAAAAGLLKGDIVTEVNGFAVSDMADLRIAMLGTREGQTIDVRIKRLEGNQERELHLPVVLTIPPIGQAHP